MQRAWMMGSTTYDTGSYIGNVFLENGYIGLGTANFGNVIGKDLEELRKLYSHSIFGEFKDTVEAVATDMDRFVNGMQEMDLGLLVLEDKVCAFEVMSECYFNVENDKCIIGWPHRRTVRFIRQVERVALSEELQKALVTEQKVKDLSEFLPEIYRLSYGKAMPKEEQGTETIRVSYPLRKDLQVQLELPADMTRAEVERLARFVESLWWEK